MAKNAVSAHVVNGRTLQEWLDAVLVPRIESDFPYSNKAFAAATIRLRKDRSEWSWDVWLQFVRLAAEPQEGP